MILETLFFVGTLAPLTQTVGVTETEPEVLFVCEHGSAKSLIARLLFEREAAKAGLKVQAVSRGMNPDEAVPSPVRDGLQQDGFDIGDWRPSALAAEDTRSATRVVLFDVQLPDGQRTSDVEHWDRMPAVSDDYAKARDAIRARVEELVKRLAMPENK